MHHSGERGMKAMIETKQRKRGRIDINNNHNHNNTRL